MTVAHYMQQCNVKMLVYFENIRTHNEKIILKLYLGDNMDRFKKFCSQVERLKDNKQLGLIPNVITISCFQN